MPSVGNGAFPPEIDTPKPHSARMYDYFLGGRAVRYLAEEVGITQFLDIGSGLPGVGNVHEVAQEVNPAASAVYAAKE